MTNLTDREIRSTIYDGYRSGHKPKLTFKRLQHNFPESAPSIATIYKWLRRFKTGHLSLEDEPRPGNPGLEAHESCSALIVATIKENQTITTQQLPGPVGVQKQP
jgi:transposase